MDRVGEGREVGRFRPVRDPGQNVDGEGEGGKLRGGRPGRLTGDVRRLDGLEDGDVVDRHLKHIRHGREVLPLAPKQLRLRPRKVDGHDDVPRGRSDQGRKR